MSYIEGHSGMANAIVETYHKYLLGISSFYSAVLSYLIHEGNTCCHLKASFSLFVLTIICTFSELFFYHMHCVKTKQVTDRKKNGKEDEIKQTVWENLANFFEWVGFICIILSLIFLIIFVTNYK